MHVWITADVDNERLTRDRVGCAEIGDVAPFGRDGGAGGDAVILAIIEAGEDAVEVGAFVGHQLPFAAEYLGNAPHQGNIETSRAIFGHELEGRVGKRRSHPQNRRGPRDERPGRCRYAYDEIEKALDDLMNGGCDAFMKLAPVTAWLVRDRPKLKVVETGITVERLGICTRNGNAALLNAIGKAQAALSADGTLAALIKTVAWGRGDYACVNVKTTSSGYFERAVTPAGPTQPPHPGSTLALA
jgi:hypothetical protein